MFRNLLSSVICFPGGSTRPAFLGVFAAIFSCRALGKMEGADRGSPGRTRTCDKAVNSRLLYQLSYRGTMAREAGV